MKTLQHLVSFSFIALAFAAASCGDGESKFEAALTAGAETPASTSTAMGTATMTLASDGLTLTYALTHNVMSPTAAHIHDGAVGAAGPVVVALDPVANAGTVVLTADQVVKLEAGGYYVNIHDAANMPGAIRGQILAK